MNTNKTNKKSKNLIADKDLKELLKVKDAKRVIYMHCNRLINLSSKQLDKLIKLKKDI